MASDRYFSCSGKDLAVPRIPGRAKELIFRFRRYRKANAAVMFGIAVIPVLGMVGAATD